MQRSFVASTAHLALVAALLGAVAVSAAGCDNPVGRICDLGVTDPDPNEAVVGSPSLDCQSKLCLKIPVTAGKTVPDGFRTLSATNGMCTDFCSSDSDCDKVPESPCVTGFTCGTPVVVGPFCCRKMCICKDYVIVPESGTLPVPAAASQAGRRSPWCCCRGRS